MTGAHRLGFGCSGPWGEAWFAEAKAIDLVHQAITLGITHFDTGNFYCNGNAEKRLGRALRDCTVEDRARLRISSKTGTQLSASGGFLPRRLVKDFTANTIRRDVETSLTRLGINALDILYLHGPNKHQLFSSLPILQQLHHEGLIGAIGICSTGEHLALAAEQAEVDVLMGAYNFLNPAHAPLFAQAKTRGKKCVAIAPLAQGLYRRGFMRPRSLPDAWYLARALAKNRPEMTQARALSWLHQQEGLSPADLAMGYVMANQDVDLAITTTTKTEHLAASVKAASLTLPAPLLARLDDTSLPATDP